MIRLRGQPYRTSGDSEYWYNLSYVYNNEERYFSYHGFNGVRPMWILTPDGRVLDGDSSLYLGFSEFCYGYDSGNGCVAGSNLPQCRSKDDNFTLMNGEFTPGMFEVTDVGNSSLSFSDCMVICWNDCRCLAFDSHDNDNGTGCNVWTGTKSAMFSVNPQGTYVRKYVLLSPTPSKVDPFEIKHKASYLLQDKRES